MGRMFRRALVISAIAFGLTTAGGAAHTLEIHYTGCYYRTATIYPTGYKAGGNHGHTWSVWKPMPC
jgi:hypothetical protein